jgi:hypothetical protein
VNFIARSYIDIPSVSRSFVITRLLSFRPNAKVLGMAKDERVQRLSLDELETRNLARHDCLLTRPGHAR